MQKMKTLSAIIFQQEIIKSTNDWIELIFIQIVLLGAFSLMIYGICKMLKPKEDEPSKKSTCIIISIMTFLAYIVIALIVWEVSEAQLLGIGVGLV